MKTSSASNAAAVYYLIQRFLYWLPVDKRLGGEKEWNIKIQKYPFFHSKKVKQLTLVFWKEVESGQ